tara:strand:- start:1078 stop:1476 length:399 start_codon:yes stop_codon:yes gene_type:complete
MRLWLEDIFDVRNYIGEKMLNDNILNKVMREIDLLMFIMNDFLKYKGNEISKDEFLDRFNNIKSNSSLKNNEIYNINNMKKYIDGNEKMFVDKVIDFDNVIAEFNEFSINSKDEDKLKKYYNKKLKEFRKVL